MALSPKFLLALSTIAFTGAVSAQAPIVRVPSSDPAAQGITPSQLPPNYPTDPTNLPQPAQAPPPSAYTSQPAYPPPPPGITAPRPPGAAEALLGLTSQPASHSAFTFDRDMLQSLLGNRPIGLNSVTIENYRYHEPAFYVPEELAALRHAYNAAGWKHLVDAHVPPREQASPLKPMTDLWLHYRGAEIDDVAVLIRAPRQMSLIEVSGMLRPLDLVHLGGHFGIPKVDPGAVMVPAPPER